MKDFMIRLFILICNTLQMLITTIILGIFVNRLSACNNMSTFCKLLMECKGWIGVYLAVGIVKIAIGWNEASFEKIMNIK